MSTFEEEIERTGKLVYTNVGDSMMPLIKQGRDLLIIEKPDGRLKRYDIPLYKRDSGQYVLQRVLKSAGERLCYLRRQPVLQRIRHNRPAHHRSADLGGA